MNRRGVLASGYSLLVTGAAGCGASGAIPNIGKTCGPADTPVSDRLVDTPGSYTGCGPPSVLIANERDTSVTATVSIEETTVAERTYEIPAGGRTLASPETNTPPETEVRVDLPEGGYEREWPAASCRRKALVIVDDDLLVGWLEPLHGPPDAVHDCYAGDDAVLAFINKSRAGPTEFTATATNRCTGASETRTFTVPDKRSKNVHGLVTTGGRYRLHTSFDTNQQATFRFPEDGNCWGMYVTYTGDNFEADPMDMW